ncbi:protein YIPF2 [Polyodon spathula]|uniref:protein YIPF2 n=1 Tax=Polyodon spathula TaxID=7913 RepID=UPI001B7EE789|nr:protein YIPF2 [Polyodon spathula]
MDLVDTDWKRPAMATPDDLQFEEFEEAAQLLSANPEAVTRSALDLSSTERVRRVRVNLSEEEGEDEEGELLSGQKQQPNFWSFDYYQSFFNIDTLQVLDRIKGSLLPLPGKNFVKHHLRNNPDLYGPFWICATLVFTVAISGNLSTFLLQMGDPKYHYRPQFHKVSVAGVSVFSYAWLVPLALWGFLQWRSSSNPSVTSYSFLETVCVYGYSLFIYIPTSILWIIPVDWLRWLLILLAMALSGSVLVLTFWPVIRDDTKPSSIATVTAILLLHALLAVGCKTYFFQTATQTMMPLLSPAPPTGNPDVLLANTTGKRS